MSTLSFARIVILDAEPERRLERCNALRDLGLTYLFAAADEEEARERTAAEPADLCIVDFTLGAEAAVSPDRSITPNPFDPTQTPAILIAADSTLATRKLAGEAGYAVVLAAPVAPRLLYRRIGWLLQRSRRIERRQQQPSALVSTSTGNQTEFLLTRE